MKKEKQYTDQQLMFMEALRDPRNEGDLRKCMDIAGYSENSSPGIMIKALTDEIIEISKQLLAAHAAKASLKIVSVLDKPDIHSKSIIAAAKEIFDRAGVVKQSEGDVKVNVGGGLLILPAKDKPEDD